MDSLFRKVGERITDRIGDIIRGDNDQPQQQSQGNAGSGPESVAYSSNRYNSFAPESSGGAKWYVDGASYFWAVSEALESARESIYILDWWLSPELYLRRPPSANEKYRLDKMLQAAAERGVKVHIIVYKEVTQALTLNSAHTRHALEGLHPNIGVFRHPDHAPANYDLRNDFKKLSINNFDLAKASGSALKNLFGQVGDVVLFWAHHEKLLVIDDRIAFMGGLDLCFGRYDTSSHPIADSHPGNLDAIIFPGQDFNNARVFDFANVDKWEDNQLDRTKSSRMGWSDVSLSLNGPIVHNLVEHFVDRWNFIWDEKYKSKDPGKYERLSVGRDGSGRSGHGEDHHDFMGSMQRHLNRGRHIITGEGEDEYSRDHGRGHHRSEGDSQARIQLTRSCCKWSSGHDTEHSISNAYISAISEARHFIYIENQFFITATSDKQRPVTNKIGKAIVDRILRARNANEDFKIIIIMPAVPAFAGDLKSDGALGTRAIMEFQYASISRDGDSIIECLQRAGVNDWQRYISFYNLRNYDRINISSTMREVERRAGVSYEEARKEHDNYVGAGYYPRGESTNESQYGRRDNRRDDSSRESSRDRGGYGRRSGDRYDNDRRDRDNYGGDHGRRDRDNYDGDYGGRGRDSYGGYGDDRGGRDNYGGYGNEYGRKSEDRYKENRRDGDNYGSSGGQYGQRPAGYERYQEAARQVSDQSWDTVSGCYMDGGSRIEDVPWQGSEESELNAYVSEELYVHSKLLIADDKLVICGSANLNDRSQLGTHDSEIAVVIEDPVMVRSEMNGRPYTASKFAASLRRYIFRKHLGLLPDQRWDKPTANWTPIDREPNEYDWGSHNDELVKDPLGRDFLQLWDRTAKNNTEVFTKVFHNVPNDRVRTWKDYDEFFSKHFIIPGSEDEKKGQNLDGKVYYGHVVPDEFPNGVREVKDWLRRVKGTLVEMPLGFLADVDDIAQEGLALNGLTDELYT
jgi:phospholipase D1/2